MIYPPSWSTYQDSTVVTGLTTVIGGTTPLFYSYIDTDDATTPTQIEYFTARPKVSIKQFIKPIKYSFCPRKQTVGTTAGEVYETSKGQWIDTATANSDDVPHYGLKTAMDIINVTSAVNTVTFKYNVRIRYDVEFKGLKAQSDV